MLYKINDKKIIFLPPVLGSPSGTTCFRITILYGVIFNNTRSIVGMTLNHGLSNTVLFIVMPFYNLLLNLPFI